MIDAWCRVCVWMHCYGSSHSQPALNHLWPSWTHSEMSFYSPIEVSETAVPGPTPDRYLSLPHIPAGLQSPSAVTKPNQSGLDSCCPMTSLCSYLPHVCCDTSFDTHLLFRSPTTINSSYKADGDDDKWTLRGRWYGCIQMSTHSPVTVKHISRCHPALSHGCTALLWEWMQHLSAVWTVMHVSLSQTCNDCIMLYSHQDRLQTAEKHPQVPHSKLNALKVSKWMLGKYVISIQTMHWVCVCMYVCMCIYIYIYILVNRWKYLIVINHMIFMS